MPTFNKRETRTNRKNIPCGIPPCIPRQRITGEDIVLGTITKDHLSYDLTCDTKRDLLTIPAKKAFIGMLVTVIDEKAVYMLTKAPINMSDSWERQGERIKTLLSTKQDKLVSGINIKTINGISLLGEGDVSISGGSSEGESLEFIREQVEKNTKGIGVNTNSIEFLNANTGVSEYPEFSEATAYAVGDVVLFEGLMYRFTSEHAAGGWIEADVEPWSEKKERLKEESILSDKINNIKPVQITNAADEEDLTVEGQLLKLKDRDTSKGMGYVILRTDKTFAEQVTQPNTIYEIRYDFDLDGAEVEIPENCVLKFDGGSLSNGRLTGNNTHINANATKIFDGVVLVGSWMCAKAYSAWFRHQVDDTNELRFLFGLAVKGIPVELENREYNVTFEYNNTFTYYTYVDENFTSINNRSAQFIAEGVDINIIGNNATIVENYNPTTHRLIQMFALKNCTGNITDIKVILTHPCDDTDDVNSLSIVHLVESCHNMNISLEGENIRTPVEAGFFGWHRPSVSNSTIRTTNKGKGYGIVLYDGFNLKLDINVNKLHRGAYIAGVTDSDVAYKGGVIYETATALLLRDTRLIIHNDQLSYVMSDSLNINMSINDIDYESGTFKGVSAITMSGYTSDLFSNRNVRYNCTFNVSMTILLDKTNDVIPLYSTETDYVGDVYNVNIALSEYVNSSTSEQKTLVNLSKESGSSYNINIEGYTNTQKRCRLYNNGVVNLKVSRFAQPTGSNYMYFEVQNTNNKLRHIVCDSPNMYYYVIAVPDGYLPCCAIEKTLMAQNVELYMSETAVSKCTFPSVVNTGFLNISKIQSADIIQTLVGDGTNTCNFYQTSGSYIKFTNGTNVRVTILAVGNQSSYRMQGDIVTNLPNNTVNLPVPSIMHFTVQNNKLHLMDVQPIQGYSLTTGSTANRPSSVGSGFLYFDTTLNKPIWWNGSAWVDATGATV